MQAELAVWWHKVQREGLFDKTWLAKEYQWSGLKCIIKIISETHDKSAGKDTTETRWYICLLDLNAKEALHAVRSHWQVESIHWVLDMTFREDEYCIRKKKMAGLDDDYRSVLKALAMMVCAPRALNAVLLWQRKSHYVM